MSISHKTEVINIDNDRRINIEIILTNPGGLSGLKFDHYEKIISNRNKKDAAIDIKIFNRNEQIFLDIYAPYIPITEIETHGHFSQK